MPCYQSTNLPSGVTTTGRTSYTTEADCNQACREGACCEGTTCTVKPQCQCVCTSGSCCGPDMFTNAAGETGPRCRTETKAQCDARGGTFRCGVGCINATDEGGGAPRPGIGICTSLASSPSTPVFKGVGTVCSPNPCDTTCKPCNGGTEPSKETVTTVVDNVVAASNSPFTTAELKNFFEGTYTLYKEGNTGLDNLILYTFGGWPVQTGIRYADMLYACLQDGVYGNAFYSTGSSFGVTYSVPGLKLVLFGYGAQSTSRGNVCTGAQQQAIANITSPNDNALYGTGRITVS